MNGDRSAADDSVRAEKTFRNIFWRLTMRGYYKWIGNLAAMCVFCICVLGGLLAQGLGSISGTVTDTTGAVVSGAGVTATQVGTGLELKTTSSAGGVYVFPSLAPSAYNVSASSQGFEAYTAKGVQVRADAAVTVNITLKTGAATETGTVTA